MTARKLPQPSKWIVLNESYDQGIVVFAHDPRSAVKEFMDRNYTEPQDHDGDTFIIVPVIKGTEFRFDSTTSFEITAL